MRQLFIWPFVLGIASGVYFVIRGTERWSRKELPRRLDSYGREALLGRVSLNSPVLAAFLASFGLAGYLMFSVFDLSLVASLAVAALAGAGAVVLAVLMVKRWAVPHALRDVPDERFLLQGQLATVTLAIPAGGSGEVTYVIDDRNFSIPAQSIDGQPIATGRDVVIERVEDGLVVVEDWAKVEARL